MVVRKWRGGATRRMVGPVAPLAPVAVRRAAFARLLGCWLLAVGLAGCAGTFQGIGNDLGKGILAAVDADGPRAVTGLSASLTKGLGDGLRHDVLTEQTNRQLAQAVETLGKTAQAQLPGIRDELVGKQTEAQLKATLDELLKALDKQAQATSRHVIVEVGQGLGRDVMSAQNEARLNELVASLGQAATAQTSIMRDQLLANSDERVRLIVGSAMKEVVLASEEIRLKAHQELSFVQRNATETVVIALGVGAVVIFFIWRQNQKNRMLLELVMGQVHQTSGDTEDELLRELGKRAKALGVDRQLASLNALRARKPGDEVKQ